MGWVVATSGSGSRDSYLICWRVSTAETKQASLLLDTICDESLKSCIKTKEDDLDAATSWWRLWPASSPPELTSTKARTSCVRGERLMDQVKGSGQRPDAPASSAGVHTHSCTPRKLSSDWSGCLFRRRMRSQYWASACSSCSRYSVKRGG